MVVVKNRQRPRRSRPLLLIATLQLEPLPNSPRSAGQLLELRKQSQPRVVGGYCRAACAESLLSGITSFHALLGAHWSGP